MARAFTLHRLASALFMALLLAPMLAQVFFGGAGTSALERRLLAAFPTLDEAVANPAALPDQISRWMEDQMGLRGPLTQIYLSLSDAVDLDDVRHVVRGEDGWLFVTLDDALLSHQGLHPFSPGEADDWIAGAMTVRQAACGKPFVILIAPDKHTIYAERLSAYPRRSARPTRLEALSAMAPEAGLAFVSPVDALLRLKQNEAAYHRTDTHWTMRGAYEGYAAIMSALTAQGLGAPLVALDRLEKAGERQHTGDLYGLLGIENPPPETTTDWRISDSATITAEERLAGYDWHGFEAKRWTSSVANAPRLLVLGDSFFNVMHPFLLESFSTVTFIHHRRGKVPLGALASCDFDAVALEIVERSLNYRLAPVP